MNQLDRMPEITEHVLAGLKADESMKHKILLSAAGVRPQQQIRSKTVVALCCVSVLLILLCVYVTQITGWKSHTSEFEVIPAGSHRVISPVNLGTVIDQASGLQESQDETCGTD